MNIIVFSKNMPTQKIREEREKDGRQEIEKRKKDY